MITLLRSLRPPAASSTLAVPGKSQESFRWLHVQHSAATNQFARLFQILERLVLNCPFISTSVRAEALRCLPAWRKSVTHKIDRTWRWERLSRATTSQSRYISLATGVFLALRPVEEKCFFSRPLLGISHGLYDVGAEQELNQAVRKLGVGFRRDVLRVATLWSLSLGPDVLITLCCAPMEQIMKGIVEIDDRASRGFYTVAVKLYGSDFYSHIVIDPDCTYLDFLTHAVAVAASGTSAKDATECDILNGDGLDISGPDDSVVLKTLSPQTWLEILGTGNFLEKTLFYVKPKVPPVLLLGQAGSDSKPNLHRGSLDVPPHHSLVDVRQQSVALVKYDKDIAEAYQKLNPHATDSSHVKNPTAPTERGTRESKMNANPGSGRSDFTENCDRSESKHEDSQTAEIRSPPQSESRCTDTDPFFTWTVRSMKNTINAASSSQSPTAKAVWHRTCPEFLARSTGPSRLMSQISERSIPEPISALRAPY
ncbi:hypothetical protein QBC47DRAFT_190273 [Echria macrotheca]|uniref:Uncharacterized protein n=1 Tax=Echria macrotheca TaxID=438768 RepID=A0AAJ0FBL7_9PEZI|nr:hypothetical protein QBC47DRAFT_190273 [Echria macrotheca]